MNPMLKLLDLLSKALSRAHAAFAKGNLDRLNNALNSAASTTMHARKVHHCSTTRKPHEQAQRQTQ